MKGLAISHEGFEGITAGEIEDILGYKSTVQNHVVIFGCKSKDDLQKLSYLGQTVIKVIELMEEIPVDESFIDSLSGIKIDISTSFKVNCKRIGEHKFSSAEVERVLGEAILKANSGKKENGCSVDVHRPETIVYAFVNKDRAYIGIDLVDKDLSKRDYKIFVHPASIKGSIASCLLRFSGYKANKFAIDPFCGSGTVMIEAALYARKISPNFFSKNSFRFDTDRFDKESKAKIGLYGSDIQLKHIMSARKNAKIAGVEKDIEFSKVELSWIDTKFEEGDADMIVSDPPRLSKMSKDYSKLMDELFYQAKYLVKENVTLLTDERSLEVMEKEAARHGFKISEKVVSPGNILVKFIKA